MLMQEVTIMAMVMATVITSRLGGNLAPITIAMNTPITTTRRIIVNRTGKGEKYRSMHWCKNGTDRY